MRRWPLAFASLAALSGTAWAHSGSGTPSLVGGLVHPLSGVDHVLAMVAVGLWAAQIGGRARWALPAAFVGVMSLGGWLGMSGVKLPFVEAGIAASVLVLGLLIAFAARWSPVASVPLVSAFAVFHGHAHGTELPAASTASGYIAGFVVGTTVLHVVGITIGAALARHGHERVVREIGAFIAVGGVAIACW